MYLFVNSERTDIESFTPLIAPPWLPARIELRPLSSGKNSTLANYSKRLFCRICYEDWSSIAHEACSIYWARNLEIEQAFGLVLRDLRQSKRLSQEKLAFEAEVDRNYISLLELGRYSATIKMIQRLAQALEISIPELMALVEARLSPPDNQDPDNQFDR